MKGSPQEAIETLLSIATLKGHTPAKYSNSVNKIEVFPQHWCCKVCKTSIVRETQLGSYDLGVGVATQCGSKEIDLTFKEVIIYLRENFKGIFF